ncbi:MAG TPA: hypothetical protein VGM51_01785 [Armatimonadota bacterium]|jgi:hypothetical protein
MAFRLVATVLAEGLSLDQVTGRLTAFNMLESVVAPSFPAVIGKLVVINLYEIEDGVEPHWERVTVLDPAGNQLSQTVTELSGEGQAHRSMGFFQGLRLGEPGVYRVLVEGAVAAEGPWSALMRRRLFAEQGAHPLARADAGGHAKVPAPSTFTG